MVFIYCLLCNTITCSKRQCKSHISRNQFRELYCPTEGTITPNLPWHQCKLLCLHTSSCQAVNYNFTSDFCTQFTTTCPRAISHLDMAFAVFTKKEPAQCMEWKPKQNGRFPDGRSVTEDNVRFVARMQKNGNDFVCYLLTTTFNCLSRDDEGKFKSSTGKYPCQYLQISDGCTVFFVDYELGATLPENALIGGHTARGLPVYIGRQVRGKGSGYYILGSNRLIVGYRIVTENVQLLVSL